MAKRALRDKFKSPNTLEQEKGNSSLCDLSQSPLSEKGFSEQRDTWLEPGEEMAAEMTGPVEQAIPQEGSREPNRKSDEVQVDMEGHLEDAERDSPAQPVDLSPIDDPLRLYLREMGHVGLLNREGEVGLAKKIEEARGELASAVFGMPMSVISVLSLREQLIHQEICASDIVVSRDGVEEEGLDDDMLAPDDEEFREQTLRELDKIHILAKPFLTRVTKRRSFR